MTVHMDQMSWVDYERRVREGAVVFLPCGATEQHGPHLPLGTDALLASAISADVAARVGGLVAPALSYGYKSQPKCGGGQHFCGTTSLDGATLSALVRDAVREFHRHGVRRLVLVLGHYENQWFVAEGIQLALRDLGPDAGLEVMRLEHWDFCHEQTLTLSPSSIMLKSVTASPARRRRRFCSLFWLTERLPMSGVRVRCENRAFYAQSRPDRSPFAVWPM